MRRRAALAAFAALAGTASASRAETVAICGATQGHAYFLHRGLVPRDEAGWTTDGMTSGRIILSRDQAGSYDVVFVDAASRAISAVADGARVLPLVEQPESLVLLLSYAATGVTEVYSFFREAGGANRVTLQQTKVSSSLPVQKVSIYVGDCTLLRLR